MIEFYCFSHLCYSTPDYGIWERGNKINHGQPELNSSSIGMAVAAMQAINGINLFGPQGGPSSTIHALPDEITRNYMTLHSALPRESHSKEVDSALLSIIGYPAFAVHDTVLVQRTKQEIIQKLAGRYGCKRFLRDGHQCVLEDTRRLHYEPSELQVFEHVECEWPLFFTYLILEGLFIGDVEQVEKYREMLKKCLVDSSTRPVESISTPVSPRYSAHQQQPNGHASKLDKAGLSPSPKANDVRLPVPKLPPGIPLVPELFILPKDKVAAEKAKPRSQDRVPNENVPLVWAQSLYILGEMLYEGYLTPAEIDPLGRHLLPTYRSTQKLDTVVQVVLIAEDAMLQAKLAMFGLETQTPDQVSPITISNPSALRDAYSVLGANSKLGLSGRPKRPIGTLGTCRLYRVQGRLYAFTPHFMDKEEFYMTMDNDYLVSVFEHELLFVRNHWWYSGRPTMVVLLTHAMMGNLKTVQNNQFSRGATTPLSATGNNSSFFNSSSSLPTAGLFSTGHRKRSLLNFMMSLKSGSCQGVRVRLGRLQEMVGTSCVESLDFLTHKIEQGYLTHKIRQGDVQITRWQDVLGGLKQRKKWDTKLTTGPSSHLPPSGTNGKSASKTPGKELKLMRNSNGPADMQSPLLAPIATDVEVDGLVLVSAALDSSTSINASTGTLNGSFNASKSSFTGSEKKGEYKLKIPSVEDRNRANSPITVNGRPSSRTGASPERRESGTSDTDALSLTLGDDSQLLAAIRILGHVTTVHDQVDLLHYIWSCRGSTFQVDLKDSGVATVGELLEEVYQRAAQQKDWNTVREVAGLLKKVVNSLTINLADLLIRQKYVTIGTGSKEFTVTSPLGPDALAEIIYSHSTGDPRVAPLIQEILLYLGSFIRSEPHLFQGILRVRIYYIIIAMREEISRARGCDGLAAMEFLMQLAPSDIKSLLAHVLSAHDQAKQMSIQKAGETSPIPSPETPNVISQELKITCSSSGYYDGNQCKIEVKNHAIVNGGERGLNVLIINPEDGTILESANFDTHISNEDSDDFAKLIETLADGIIVAVTAKDDAFEQLTEAARLACESIGSTRIRQMKYRDSWCIVGKKGAAKGTATEDLQPAKSGKPATAWYQHSFSIAVLSTDTPIVNDLVFEKISTSHIMPCKGSWSRRRYIDGALQRTPVGFYPKVHKILEKSSSGLLVNGAMLPRDPVVSEKTPEEVNFALQVENLLNAITDPAERQVAVECLMVIFEIQRRNPEMRLGGSSEPIDLMKIVREAYVLFWNYWLEHEASKLLSLADAEIGSKLPTGKAVLEKYPFAKHEDVARRLFYDLPQDGVNGSLTYLAKSIMRSIPYEINFNASATSFKNTTSTTSNVWSNAMPTYVEPPTADEDRSLECRPM